MKVNFHMHTIHSDGGKSVPQLVELLKNAEVEFFSITDHNSVDGNKEAAELAKENGIEFVTGVELTSKMGIAPFDNSYFCHILGYGIDVEKMQIELNNIERNKSRALFRTVKELRRDGYDIFAREMAFVPDFETKLYSRIQIAAELLRKGQGKSIWEIFEKILNTPKYLDMSVGCASIENAIDAIHNSGGLACWAHPYYMVRNGKIMLNEEKLNAAVNIFDGLKNRLDGIEVFYQNFDSMQINALSEIADAHGWFKTIGTDYHSASLDKVKFPSSAQTPSREALFFEKAGVEADYLSVDLFRSKYPSKKI